MVDIPVAQFKQSTNTLITNNLNQNTDVSNIGFRLIDILIEILTLDARLAARSLSLNVLHPVTRHGTESFLLYHSVQ